MRERGADKILVLRGGAMGDFIVTLPALLASALWTALRRDRQDGDAEKRQAPAAA